MFTLHYDDSLLSPVVSAPDPILHMATARKLAREVAELSGVAILICVNDRARVRIMPDGRVEPPAGVEVNKRELCQAHEGVPCFCTACRTTRSELSTGGRK